MPHRRLRLLAGALGLLFGWCCLAAAQEKPAPKPAETGKPAAIEPGKPTLPEPDQPTPAEPGKPVEPSAPAAPKLEEAQPTLYHLKDKSGKLVPMPNFTLEDFEELYKLKHQLARQEQPPRFTLQQVSARGTAMADHADLTVNVRVLLREDQWVRVPLRFDGALLREPATYRGPGEQSLSFDEQEGYVSWIRGQAGQQHELTLKFLVPLTTAGDDTRLKLTAPRATLSDLKLKVPLGGAVAKVSEGAALATTSAAGNAATEFSVSGLGGDFEISWRKSTARAADVPVTLDAVAVILARVDGHGIDSEATLSVRSHGAAFDRFRVRLPPGVDPPLGSASPGYSVMPVEEGSPPVRKPGLVEVRLTKKTSGPVEVRLNTYRARDTGKPDELIELAGFVVEGAKRQAGTIALAPHSDWQVIRDSSEGLRPADQLPDALRRRTDVAGAFEYSAQPCSLKARIVQKLTRLSVEPEYQLQVEADRVTLEARLKYTVRGAKATSIRVALPGWEKCEFGPDTLVAVGGVAASGNNVLTVPLLQPTGGQFEVRVTASRPLAADATALALRLPQPQADTVGAAALTVTSPDRIELTPNDAAMAGLMADEVAARIAVPEGQQPRLSYRAEKADRSELTFAADRRMHARSVAVDVATRLALAGREAEVQETLGYRIEYERLDHFLVDVPRTLAGSPSLQFLCRRERAAKSKDSAAEKEGPIELDFAPAHREEDGSDSETVQMRVALPNARLGKVELLVRYSVVLSPWTPGESGTVIVPLVMPADDDATVLSGNRLVVAVPGGLRLESAGSPWRATAREDRRQPTIDSIELTAPDRTAHVELTLQAGANEELGAPVVERAWVQTRLTQSFRQDRAVFRFTSSRKEVEFSIPAGAVLGKKSVALDGSYVAPRPLGENRLAIALPQDGNQRARLLELRYHFPDQRPRRGPMSFDLPRLGHDVWTRHLYWQFMLPADEHAIAAPAGFTSEHAWNWQFGFLGRKPLLAQDDLERWSGAPHLDAVPEGVNCYLYSAFGNIEQAEVRTAGRAWIVLLASGAALVAGLLLIYVPRSRHPATLLCAAVALLGVGIIYPEPTLLFSQAVILGLAMTLLAGLLERRLSRRRRTAQVADRSSVALQQAGVPLSHRAAAAGQGSTQSAPAIVSTSNPDANA